MRIASGVILIIAAVINLFAAFGYLAGGAATTALTEAGTQVIQEQAQQTEELTEEQKAQAEEALAQARGSSTMFLAFGVFLLVAVGIMIAGAVFLFQGKKAGFIYFAGAIALVAEIIGILITVFGPFNLVGIIGGLLAIISAKMMTPSPTGEAA